MADEHTNPTIAQVTSDMAPDRRPASRHADSPRACLPDADSPHANSVDLPPANTTRWVIRRKALVVAGVHNGLITLEEACTRYNLSLEEFQSWQRQIERYGLPGLRATRLQDYRQNSPGDSSAVPRPETVEPR
jgi:hypothetical protein